MAQRIQQWDYRVQAIEIGGHEAGMGELSKLGDAGWELVQVIGEPIRGGRMQCIFKRPRPQRDQPARD